MIGGIVLSCVGFGALFRPIRAEEEEEDNDGEKGRKEPKDGDVDSDVDSDCDSRFDEEDRKGLLMETKLVLPTLQEVPGAGDIQTPVSRKKS